jgi:hypothetical protein
MAILGILALAGSCHREPAARAVPSDATFSASDPRCTFSQRAWGTSTEQIAGALAYTVKRGAARNWIRLDAKSFLTWNGKPVDNSGLLQFADRSTIDVPSPVTIVAVDRRAGCGALRTMIARVEKAAMCQPELCLIGWADVPADPNRGPLIFLPTYPL